MIGKETVLFILDKLRGRSVLLHYQEMMKNQWLTPDQITRLQDQKLRRLIEYSYEKVPYYRAIFKANGLLPTDVKNTVDLRKVPVLTKEEIIKYSDKLVSSDYYGKDLIGYPTSGSTGKPILMKFDKSRFDFLEAEKLRFESFYNLGLDSNVALILGESDEVRKSDTLKGKIRNKLLKRIILDAFRMDAKKMRQFAEQINQFKPEAITAYSTAMYLFSDFLEKNNIGIFRPRAICTTAEMLFPFMRHKIESVFKCKVYNSYGCREAGIIAQECDHGEMHLNSDNLVVEFTRWGKPANEKEIGEIIVTDLNSYAMPLIRYQIEDLGSWKGGVCKCMRGLPMMSIFAGRRTDVFTLPDKSLIHGELFAQMFDNAPNIKQFRIVQVDIKNIQVSLVVDDKYSYVQEKLLIKNIKSKTKNLINIKVDYIKEINPMNNGKYCFIKSNVKPRI